MLLQKGSPSPKSIFIPFFLAPNHSSAAGGFDVLPLLLRRMAVTPLDQRIFSNARMSRLGGSLVELSLRGVVGDEVELA